MKSELIFTIVPDELSFLFSMTLFQQIVKVSYAHEDDIPKCIINNAFSPANFLLSLFFFLSKQLYARFVAAGIYGIPRGIKYIGIASSNEMIHASESATT